ncbi:MAG: Hsp20/alpha crystallin family protein [Thermoplasmata archaeon]
MIRRKEKKEGIVPRDYWGPTWTNPMALLNDMDRLFEDFRSDWENAFMIPRAFTTDLVRQPLVDLSDNGKEYVVKAEVPGIKKEDLNIEVTENGIEISGETKVEEKEEDKDRGYLRKERRYAKFYRSLPLPDAVLTDKADAELKDGILTVKLPKAAPLEKKSKKISVK